jgi:16S rRNA (uracil1498-N3)-methyltransferase
METFFSQNIKDDLIILDNLESRHCIKVLRKVVGDHINVVDGKGNLYKGKIISTEKNNCKVHITNILTKYGDKGYYIHIGIACIKNHDRLQWFVEKSVEIGVDEISFLYCDRSIKKTIKNNRISNVAITAMKQSGKARLPIINDLMNFKDFTENCKNQNKFICHLYKNDNKNIFSYKEKIKKNKNSCILIGPEGDFTISEIKLAEKYNFKSITLGDSCLRTETAGIVACNLLNLLNTL